MGKENVVNCTLDLKASALKWYHFCSYVSDQKKLHGCIQLLGKQGIATQHVPRRKITGIFLSIPKDYRSILISLTFKVFISGRTCPPTFLFFYKRVLSIFGPLHFHINFGISMSCLKTNFVEILARFWLELNLYTHLEKMGIYIYIIRLSKIIREHWSTSPLT